MADLGQIRRCCSVNMHPIAFAAWFGLLATAFNLFPIAQLDGGHIAYAMFGRRATYITLRGAGDRRSRCAPLHQLVCCGPC